MQSSVESLVPTRAAGAAILSQPGPRSPLPRRSFGSRGSGCSRSHADNTGGEFRLARAARYSRPAHCPQDARRRRLVRKAEMLDSGILAQELQDTVPGPDEIAMMNIA